MTSKASKDVLSEIFQYVPEKDLAKIVKSAPRLPKLALLSAKVDLDAICSTLTIQDFHILLRNKYITKQKLFKCAIGKEYHEEVEKLLKNPKVDPTITGQYDVNVMAVAADHGDTEMVKILLKDGRVSPNLRVGINSTAISLAASRGHLDVVKALMSDTRTYITFGENQPLAFAAMGGHLDVVREFLKNPKVLKEGIGRALTLAVRDDHPVVAREIIRHNKHMLYSSYWNWALALASEKGDVDIVSRLLKLSFIDPSIKATHSYDKFTSIRNAYENKHYLVVRLLAQHPKVKTPAHPDLEVLTMILDSLTK